LLLKNRLLADRQVPEERFELRLFAEAVKVDIDMKGGQPHRMFVEGLAEPAQRLGFVSQTRMDQREIKGIDIFLLRPRFELSEIMAVFR
jgi:type III secretory pathway component EscR